MPDDQAESQAESQVEQTAESPAASPPAMQPIPASQEYGQPPPPGIYTGIGRPEYDEWPLINASKLMAAKYSAQHLKASIDGLLDKESDARIFGTAFHCRLLEPTVYKATYITAGTCAGVLKSGPNKGNDCGGKGKRMDPKSKLWYCDKHAGDHTIEPENFVSEADHFKIEQMANVVKEHKVVNLLRQHGGYEASIVANFPEWDVTCKARVDKWIAGALSAGGGIPPTIVDLKKTRLGHARTDKFTKDAEDMGYDYRAAFYCDAVRPIIGELPKYIFVVVEDTYPFAVNVLEADDDFIKIGRLKYRDSLDMYKAGVTTGVWPGYASDIGTISPSWWSKRQYKGLL